MMKNNPEVFLNQREAYWYLQGLKDSQNHMNMLLNQDIQRYSMEYTDHLPEGDVEANKVLPEGAGKGKLLRHSLKNWGVDEKDWETFCKVNVFLSKELEEK